MRRRPHLPVRSSGAWIGLAVALLWAVPAWCGGCPDCVPAEARAAHACADAAAAGGLPGALRVGTADCCPQRASLAGAVALPRHPQAGAPAVRLDLGPMGSRATEPSTTGERHPTVPARHLARVPVYTLLGSLLI